MSCARRFGISGAGGRDTGADEAVEARRGLSIVAGREVWIGLLGLLALQLVLAFLLFDPKPFIGGDNAAYMILAEALESGRGYRDLYLPGNPRHAQYPPAYPAILALIGLLGGGLIAYKLFSALCAAASVVLVYLIGQRRIGPIAAFGVALPLALSPLLLDYSHWVLSETPFLLFTLAALWAGERLDQGSSRWLGAAVALALLAYLTRAAGIPLLIAMLGAVAWKRDWRRTGVVAAAFGVVMAGWWLWGRMAADESAQVYQENFLLIDPYTPELGYVGPGDLLVRLVNNAGAYAVRVLPEALAGPSPTGPGLLVLLVTLALIALALAGWARSIRRVGVVELFTVFYAGLILVWPQVWTDRRFLLPLLPMIFLYAMEGTIWCFEFLRAARPVWIVPGVGVLVALLSVPGHLEATALNQRCLRVYRQGDRLACYPEAWRAFFQAALWVGENTPEDAIVISRKPRLLFLFGRRQGDAYPFVRDDRQVLDRFDAIGADYVIVAALSGTTQRYLIPVIQRHTERFEPVYRAGEPPSAAYVLRYRGPVQPGAGGP